MSLTISSQPSSIRWNDPVQRKNTPAAPFLAVQKDARPAKEVSLPLFEGLTQEQQDSLRNAWAKLTSPQPTVGVTGTERWDTFLVKLKDCGLITQDEYMLAGGHAIAIPHPDEEGQMYLWRPAIPGEQDMSALLERDPFAWLDFFMFYQGQIRDIAKLEGYDTSGIEGQLAACQKVKNIVGQFQTYLGGTT